MALSPLTVLRRAGGFRFDLASSGELTIDLEAGSFAVGPHGLALLALFERPRTLAEALTLLRARLAGAQDWIDLTTTVERLVQAGVLSAEGSPRPAPAPAAPAGVSRQALAWLDSGPAVEALLDAIGEVVRPGDVVVDLGSATGLLAIAAARAGAGQVYAVTMGEAGELVAAGAARNGVAGRVRVVREWPAWDMLPREADVVVSEAFSYDLAGLPLVGALREARRRLLGPRGRLVPARLALQARLVRAPAAERARRSFTPEVVARWREWYAIDFGPCAEASARAATTFTAAPDKTAGWPRVGAAATLCADLLEGPDDPRGLWSATATVEVGGAGAIDGAELACAAQLTPTRWLPAGLEQERGAWPRRQICLLAAPLAVEVGDRLALTYSRGLPPPGDRLEIGVVA